MHFLEVKCSSCGESLHAYMADMEKYGKMIRKCKKCGSDYLDPRYQELAITGIPEKKFSLKLYLIDLAVGVGIFLLEVLKIRVGLDTTTGFFNTPTLLLIGTCLSVWAIFNIIGILTGLKRKKFERMKAESEDRMRDRAYVQTMRRLGVDLPEKYTDEYWNGMI